MKLFKRIGQFLLTKIKSFSITDLMLICGAGILFYGIYKMYIPASYIFGGLFLIAWAVLIEYNSRGKE